MVQVCTHYFSTYQMVAISNLSNNGKVDGIGNIIASLEADGNNC